MVFIECLITQTTGVLIFSHVPNTNILVDKLLNYLQSIAVILELVDFFVYIGCLILFVKKIGINFDYIRVLYESTYVFCKIYFLC